ncbi:MAG TPA: hypothetical protein G4O10_06540 [Dehalococcoidia bacterium]|nr:hypothetical protein [Dehalococcoidia bacterium]
MGDFLTNTFLPTAIVVVVAIAGLAWIIRLFLYFGFRYRDWKKGIANPLEKKETMGLPKGAMRTFLALSFSAIATMVLLKGADYVVVEDKKWILLELGAIITFYFGSKSLEAFVDSRAKLKAIEKAETTDDAVKVYRIVEDIKEDEENKAGAKK